MGVELEQSEALLEQLRDVTLPELEETRAELLKTIEWLNEKIAEARHGRNHAKSPE